MRTIAVAVSLALLAPASATPEAAWGDVKRHADREVRVLGEARPPLRPDPAIRAARTARRLRAASTDGIEGVWYRLAVCESGMNGVPRWDYDGPSGYDGGLQFHPGTWQAYRHPHEPTYAWQASPAVQIAVAERVLAAQGWGAWPACSRKLGLR